MKMATEMENDKRLLGFPFEARTQPTVNEKSTTSNSFVVFNNNAIFGGFPYGGVLLNENE